MESTFDTTLLSVVISLAIIAITVAFVTVLYKVYRILQSIHRISMRIEGLLHNAQGAVKGAVHSMREQLAAIPGIGFIFQKKHATSHQQPQNQQHNQKPHVPERSKAAERIFERPTPPQPAKPIAIAVKNFAEKHRQKQMRHQKPSESIKSPVRPAVKTSQLASSIFGPIPSATPTPKKKTAKKKKA